MSSAQVFVVIIVLFRDYQSLAVPSSPRLYSSWTLPALPRSPLALGPGPERGLGVSTAEERRRTRSTPSPPRPGETRPGSRLRGRRARGVEVPRGEGPRCLRHGTSRGSGELVPGG